MEFFIYLLKANIAILLFYSLYRLFYRKDTFFQWKRIFLLGMIFTSLTYPLVQMPEISLSDRNTPAYFLFQSESFSEKAGQWIYTLPEIVVTNNAQAGQTHWSLLNILLGVYLLGMIVLFIRFAVQFFSLIYIVLRSREIEYGDFTVRIRQEIQTPFSFFNWIVIDLDQHTESELEEILNHEDTHIRQYHSIDAVLSELFCIFCWINPLAWSMKREIRMNLEYLADRSVITSGFDSTQYQFHLLRLCHHKAAAKLSNNFNVSPLKSRITMMNKKETSLWNIAKYALFIPLAFALIGLNSCTKDPGNKSGQQQEVQAETNDAPAPQQKAIADTNVDEQIYSHVDTPPQFPGGEEALMKYMHDNINYPEKSAEKGIQGRVTIRFVVAPDGSIDQVEVLKSLDESTDAEAMRVIKAMPKWIPGKQNGKDVSVYYTLPVRFQLVK